MQSKPVTAPAKRRAQMQRISPHGLALYTMSTSIAHTSNLTRFDTWQVIHAIRDALDPASD